MKEKTMNLIKRIYRLLVDFKRGTYRLFCAAAMCAVTAFGFAPSANAATTYYVDGSSGSDSNTGILWSQAYATLYKALSVADGTVGDVVWVAAGTYFPDDGTGDPDNRSLSFDMKSELAVYGGFAGGELNLEDRDIVANETILSGEIGDPFDHNDNSVHVVSFDSLTGSPAILDGFTVSDGDNTDFGGGIIVDSTADAIIRNCILRDNDAVTGGGVGAVFNSLGDVLEIRNCRFVGNGAVFGGGIALKFSDDAEINVINCEFSLNDAAFGGGLYASSGNVTVVNAIFTENTADNPEATANGGGAYFTTGAEALLINSLFLFNTSSNDGGAVYVTGSATTAELNNCTLSKNYVDNRGGGIVGNNSTQITITNGILWGNMDDAVATDLEEAQLLMLSGMATVTYTCIEGLEFYSGGTGNIPDDPDFVEEDGSDPDEFDSEDNFRLYYESPCIDAADNDAVPCDQFDVDEDGEDCDAPPQDTPDLDFNDRRIDDPESSDTGNGDPPIVDMGAYEFKPCPADLDGDCKVGVKDLLILLRSWGPCPDPPVGCPADFDFDDSVGVKDLLFLLGRWGPCPCAPEAEVLSLDEELEDACLSWANWYAFVGVMTSSESSQEEKDNYYCWMEHYLFECTKCSCTGIPCPGPDPYIP